MGTLRLVGQFVAVALIGCVCGTLRADQFQKERTAETLYDQGVHAFFDEDYARAIKLLGMVETLGSNDPRPYYFLGLAYLRQENENKADKYLAKASVLEWEGRGVREYDISGAIKRIQGNERIAVECYRKLAKTNWAKAEKARRDVKYKQSKEEENSVLTQMRKAPAPLPESLKTKPFVGQAPFGARSVDPRRGVEGTDEAEVTERI